MLSLDKKTATQSAQVQQMFLLSKVSLLASTCLAVILAYVQHEVISSFVLQTWLLVVVLITISRWILTVAYQRSVDNASFSAKIWLTRFRIGVVVAGMAWGSASFLIFPANDLQHQAFLIFIIAGLTTGGVVAFSADMLSAILFTALINLPLIIRLLSIGTSESDEMAGAVILYIGFIIVSLRRFNKSLCENIELRLESAEREETMRVSEERYRLLLSHSPVGIFHYNTELVITYCNDHFADILHCSVDRIVGLDIQLTHDQTILNVMNRALQGEKCFYEGFYSFPISDTGFYAAITCAPSLDSEGKIVGGVAIFHDITERKAIEAEVVFARDTAERANRAKSEFLSSMSHELRTPMNAVLGFAQILEYDDKLDSDQKDSVHEIIKGGQHLLKLINEVLDLAKIESGHIDLSLEPVEVSSVVDECLVLVTPLADKRSIQIAHGDFKGSMVSADRTRLKQVLLNLLSNAIKYNRDGGRVNLDVRQQSADRIRILVSDTGFGIPAERLIELFQPFNRLNAENSGIEGTGIGLTITKRIVEAMGGTMGVESEVGEGSTFWIELLLEERPEITPENDIVNIADAAIEAVQHTHTILYIDDNPVNLKLVAQILSRRKHIHLVTAHTPELGIELAHSHQPELILLDINMPGMDGYQVLEIFKADANLKNTPVIAVTANAMSRDVERGMAAGFSGYLVKPLQMAEFLKTIDLCLNG